MVWTTKIIDSIARLTAAFFLIAFLARQDAAPTNFYDKTLQVI